MPRLFVAIAIEPTPILQALMEDLERLRTVLKPVRLEQLHLTLRFFGEATEELAAALPGLLDELTRPQQHFPLRLQGLDVFGAGLPRLPRVIYAPVEPVAPVRGLFDRLTSALTGHASARAACADAHPFAAHVTLARQRPNRSPNRQHQQRLQQFFTDYGAAELARQLVRHVDLMQSELLPDGPLHTLRHRAHLSP